MNQASCEFFFISRNKMECLLSIYFSTFHPDLILIQLVKLISNYAHNVKSFNFAFIFDYRFIITIRSRCLRHKLTSKGLNA